MKPLLVVASCPACNSLECCVIFSSSGNLALLSGMAARMSLCAFLFARIFDGQTILCLAFKCVRQHLACARNWKELSNKWWLHAIHQKVRGQRSGQLLSQSIADTSMLHMMHLAHRLPDPFQLSDVPQSKSPTHQATWCVSTSTNDQPPFGGGLRTNH